MTITLRTAQLRDVAQMYTISSRVHLSEYYVPFIPCEHRERFERIYCKSQANEARFRGRMMNRLNDPKWRIIVAEYAKQIVGYTMAVHTPDALELRSLFVDPDFQSHGIGSQLFSQSVSSRRTDQYIRLVVIADNLPAKSLYHKNGFNISRTAACSFYGAEQVVMERHDY